MAARSAVLFADNFNYPDGALTNAAPAVWLVHSSGTDLMVSGGQVQINSTLTEDVHAALTNQPFTNGSGVTIYSSFTVKFTALPTAGGSYFAHYNSSGSFRALVWASTANTASGFRLGIGNSTAATANSGQWTVDLATNVTYTVVTRYVVGTGSTTLWLNPTNESDPSVTATDATSAISISNFSLRQASGIGTSLLDNLIVGTSFADVVNGATNPPATNLPPVFTTQPSGQTANTGDTVVFNVTLSGTAPFGFQWKSNSVAIPGATNDTLTLVNVTTNYTGSSYLVTVTNIAGATNSQSATLTVNPPAVAPPPATNTVLTYMTYNLHGNGETNWTTNTAQAQAIGRQIAYLNPDIISFNEIPHGYTNEMTNWVTAFMPGYYIAVSPGTDGFIHSGVASRYPITRSQKWLDGVSLAAFGYSGNFARDLFEAEIAVPGFPQHVHAFVAHLKATTSGGQSDADKRAAEASCVSNFFVNTFLAGTNRLHPYILSGDMNEDVFRPATNDYITGQPIQRLTSAPTGLRLTTPTNQYDLSISNDMTESIQATRLSVRFDYILPCTLLFSNITGSQVFRTDKLPPPLPPNIFSNDDKIASDHLPVVMSFANPFTKPFGVTSFARGNPAVTLQWGAVPGGVYRVENSTNLLAWSATATNLIATNYSYTFTTNNVGNSTRFFRVRTQ